MSNRVRVLTVNLDDDYRDDDAASIIAAIQQLRGVQVVTAERVDYPEFWAAEHKVRSELTKRLKVALFSPLSESFPEPPQ